MLQGKENAKIQKKFLAEVLKEYTKFGYIKRNIIAAKEDGTKAMLIFEDAAGFVLPKGELFVTTSARATDSDSGLYASRETNALEAKSKGKRCKLTENLKCLVRASKKTTLREFQTENGELVHMQEQYYKLFPADTTFLFYKDAFFAFASEALTLDAWHGVVMRYRLSKEDN